MEQYSLTNQRNLIEVTQKNYKIVTIISFTSIIFGINLKSRIRRRGAAAVKVREVLYCNRHLNPNAHAKFINISIEKDFS